MIRVRVFKDGLALPPVDIAKTEVVVGRGGDADIQLAAEAVSRRHARLTRTSSGWQIADLGAANGVYVSSGEGPPERVVIRAVSPGDQIHIESFVLLFEEVEIARPAVHDVEDVHETSGETRRTQLISMVDVLSAREVMAREGASHGEVAVKLEQAAVAPPPRVVAVPPSTSAAPVSSVSWWVHLSSSAGHQRSFSLVAPQVCVGSASTCEVQLPEGPGVLVALERAGDAVALKRVSRWPFPRVQVDGRTVREIVLQDGDAFSVGDFELRLHLKAPPGPTR